MRPARGLSAPFLSSSSPDDVLYTPRCLVAPFWYVRWFGGRQDGRIGVAFLGCGASHVKYMTVKEAWRRRLCSRLVVCPKRRDIKRGT